MKRVVVTGALLALGITAAACSDGTGPENSLVLASSQVGSVGPAVYDPCGTPTSFTLWAGQDIDAGHVSIGNDGENLYVTFVADAPWQLAETHVHVATSVGDIPHTKNQQPIPGQFDYGTQHDPYVSSYSYTIPLGDWEAGDDLVIAAHASVVKVENGEVVQQETGWGGDIEGPSNRWWFYAEYQVQECGTSVAGDPDMICQTAFAYGSTTLNELGFRRWGWQIDYANDELPATLWAGAAQNDTLKGTAVGTVDVSQDGDILSVTYTMDPDFFLYEVHAYVGDQAVPTEAPGQFGHVDEDLDGLDSYAFENINVAGMDPINIVAHAKVCWAAPTD